MHVIWRVNKSTRADDNRGELSRDNESRRELVGGDKRFTRVWKVDKMTVHRSVKELILLFFKLIVSAS